MRIVALVLLILAFASPAHAQGMGTGGPSWYIEPAGGGGGGGGVTSVTGAGTVNCVPTVGDVICTGSGGGGSPAGSTGDIQTNAGGGSFGAITPATGIATFLTTPTSANLAAAVTNETGTGLLVFNNGPTFIAPALGTPASGVATNLTGLPLTTGVTGTLPVANGGTGLTSGTSGGILAYTASGTLASSGALTANLPVIGGGAGVAPTVGTRSGNTTAYVTTTGTQTSGDCVKIDANGNHIANGSSCGASSGLTINSTTISGGAANKVLYDDGTKLQEGSLTAGTANLVVTAPLTISSTNAQNSPADGGSHSYTVLSGDLTKEVILANTYTALVPPQAVGSFGAGASFSTITKSAVTATPTTSLVNGLASIKLAANQFSQWDSDGTNWFVGLGVPQPATQTGTTYLRDDMTWVTPSAGVTSIATTSPITGGTITTTGTIACATCVTSATSLTSNALMTGAGSQASQTVTTGTGALTALAVNTGSAGAFLLNTVARGHNIGWIATVNPNNATVFIAGNTSTIVSIVGDVETATGSAATISVYKAPSGTACSAGTILHSGSFNANGTAATNQTLTLTNTTLTAGDRVCLQTTGTTSWTGGTGIGGLSVNITVP